MRGRSRPDGGPPRKEKTCNEMDDELLNHDLISKHAYILNERDKILIAERASHIP